MRLIGLDILRGAAIILMIVYHFFYDLNYFAYIDIDFLTPHWTGFRYLIITIFLSTVGFSLVLSHQQKINWHSVFKRIIVLGFASLLVSIGSYQLFPNSWIYFGILHFIFWASLLSLPVLFHPKIAIILSMLIYVALISGINDYIWLTPLKTWQLLPNTSEDFVPIFPWLAVVLFTIGIARLGFYSIF